MVQTKWHQCKAHHCSKNGGNPARKVDDHLFSSYDLWVLVYQRYKACSCTKETVKSSICNEQSKVFVVPFADTSAHPWTVMIYYVSHFIIIPWTSMQASQREQWKDLGGLMTLQVRHTLSYISFSPTLTTKENKK
jgi:hypothetical protein